LRKGPCRAHPPVAVRLRRDFGAVRNLIRAHAIFQHASRQRDAEGRIVATLEDYAAIRDLVADLISEGVEATVPATVRETVQKLALLYSDESELVTIVKLAEELELDKSAAWRRVRTAIDLGYVKNLEERKGRPAQLVPGEPLPDDLEVLPAVARLQAIRRGSGRTYFLRPRRKQEIERLLVLSRKRMQQCNTRKMRRKRWTNTVGIACATSVRRYEPGRPVRCLRPPLCSYRGRG
jgi:hypothetical protein